MLPKVPNRASPRKIGAYNAIYDHRASEEPPCISEGLEYVSDENGNMCIPFYAFYKYIGKNEYGIDTYAKTYVPAVQVSGYEKYFESQKDNHKSNWYVDEVE